MDLSSVTLAGLVAIGVVNVLTMFFTDLDSKIKFAAALVTAFAVTFIPAELGNILLDHIKTALTVAFASSGVYKLGQVVGDSKGIE